MATVRQRYEGVWQHRNMPWLTAIVIQEHVHTVLLDISFGNGSPDKEELWSKETFWTRWTRIENANDAPTLGK